MAKITAALNNYFPLPEGLSQYPVDFIEFQGAIKLKEQEDEVLVGITPKTQRHIRSMLKIFHRKEIRFLDIDPVELSAYLGNKLGESKKDEDHSAAVYNDKVALDKLANDAPIINLVNSICIEGIHSNASDIHLETTDGDVRIRYRIDGRLRTIRSIELSRFPAISSRIKIMANLNILERRQPQDGRITVSLGNETADLRVSIIPTATGESIVLRILGRRSNLSSLEDLGFHQQRLKELRNFIHLPHGLTLVTGPTGSGKSTTLNSMLKELVSDAVKIIAIEDPVEFTIPGVNQIQINEKIGLRFNTILRRALRQDPNILMIGEIRDSETAELAIRSALTGHLVLSTLHTNDAVSVIPRLINMGVEPYLLASVLSGASAQRLVRKLCPLCRTPRRPSTKEAALLKTQGVSAEQLYQPAGCGACNQSGFTGRTVVAETFAMDEELETLIAQRADLGALRDHLYGKGMRTLQQEGLKAAAEGITTIEEIEREIAFPEDLPS